MTFFLDYFVVRRDPIRIEGEMLTLYKHAQLLPVNKPQVSDMSPKLRRQTSGQTSAAKYAQSTWTLGAEPPSATVGAKPPCDKQDKLQRSSDVSYSVRVKSLSAKVCGHLSATPWGQGSVKVRPGGFRPAAVKALASKRINTLTDMLSPKAPMTCFSALSCSEY